MAPYSHAPASQNQDLPAGSRRAALRERMAGARARMLASAESANIGIAATFILLVIGLIIAIKFLPTLTASVAEAQGDGNLSASDSSLLDLVPTVTVVVLVIAAIGVLFFQMRKSGINRGG